VGDRQRPDRLLGVGDRFEGDQLALLVAQIEQRKRLGILLIFLGDLENDKVLVGRRVDGGNLARAKGAIEDVLDLLRGEAEGLSRSMLTMSWGLVIWRSELTSMRPGTSRTFSMNAGVTR
jgi:hypothetical protein